MLDGDDGRHPPFVPDRVPCPIFAPDRVAARELEETCSPGQPCPSASGGGRAGGVGSPLYAVDFRRTPRFRLGAAMLVGLPGAACRGNLPVGPEAYRRGERAARQLS